MRNDDVYLQLYLIRHAESMGNIETNEEFDKINPPLTAHGKKQAEALGKRFEEQKPDVVNASPLARLFVQGRRQRLLTRKFCF